MNRMPRNATRATLRALTAASAALLSLAGACPCRPDPVLPIVPANIVLDPTALEFGDVPVGISAFKRGGVRNTGELELLVDSIAIEGSSTFVILSEPRSVVRERDEQVLVGFTPTVVGDQSADATFHTSDPDTPTARLPLHGRGVDDTVCVPCEQPPAAYCATDITLIRYVSVGTCAANPEECAYRAVSEQCAGECDPTLRACITVDADAGVPPDAGEPSDAGVGPDAGEPPDAGPDDGTFCIRPSEDYWGLTGNEYCARAGLKCAGVSGYSGSATCDGDPDNLCEGVGPVECCGFEMSWYVVSYDSRPDIGSVLWQCQERCPAGTEPIAGRCIDINECARGTDTCAPNEGCTNTDGSFTCGCPHCPIGTSYDGTACATQSTPGCVSSCDDAYTELTGDEYCARFNLYCTGYAADYDRELCLDITATQSEDPLWVCPISAQGIAGNAPAAVEWLCEDACVPGTEPGPGHACRDIDECAAGTDDCDAANDHCVNQRLTYTCCCDEPNVFNGSTCAPPLGSTPNCRDSCQASAGETCAQVCHAQDQYCLAANVYYDSRGCRGVPSRSRLQGQLGTSSYTASSFMGDRLDGSIAWECSASCAPGLRPSTRELGACEDIDECGAGTDDCAPRATCNNTFGGYTCTCALGYSGDGRACAPTSTTESLCMYAQDTALWPESGATYCARFGKTCAGLNLFDGNETCAGTPDPACNGLATTTCCQRSLSQLEGAGASSSGLWVCQ